ncbi:helix-turn-helix domain-containing protein [Capillimicrobium parvum]|uniref:Helix-turn-helix domain-containing protein n=1 Tax=Capillimicrobium parvum TaxID=2884022 RepID=A0A9E7C2V0_9ACTN|nr:helix-turn-helix domain-containing protein [Capillimicrobium parvum]UGS38940.1 hypothetical protein DSM104329_05372 [Capillimicrobium parvum]
MDERQADLLTIRQVAGRLGLSPLSVRRRISSGELPAIRLGDSDSAPLRVAREDLDAYVAEHRTATNQETPALSNPN